MKTFRYRDKKRHNYFEGWYLRLTDVKKNTNIALIFALTKDKDDPHAFLQYYNGATKEAHYYRYDLDAFQYDSESDTVHIGENFLSLRQCRFHTKDVTIEAKTESQHFLTPFKGRASAMGYLENAPLECFQEVLYLDAEATFSIDGVDHRGKAYMEKTYGTNFPNRWIWLQSNHGQHGSRITFSVGKVPVLFFRVKGFFLIYEHEGTQHRFGSYNLSRITVNQVTHNDVSLTIRKGKTRIELTATTKHPVKLVGPRKNGKMDLDVFESLQATATIQVFRKNDLLFEDQYTQVGLELMY